MKALLLYPLFPKSSQVCDRFMQVVKRDAVLSLTELGAVAQLLSDSWETRFYDRNVATETDADWEWCDAVILAAVLPQEQDFLALIQKAVQLGKQIAVSKSYPGSAHLELWTADVDYLVVDEGKIATPLFGKAIAQPDEPVFLLSGS